jgi:hypothetical protein
LGRSGRPDVATLVAGVALIVLGGLLLLDSQGALELQLGALAPIACAAVGAVLLASGLSRRD